MSKAMEENKKKVTIKILVWEFNLHWKFMGTDKNNDKNKTKFTPSHLPFTVFLIAEKLLNSMKFSDF